MLYIFFFFDGVPKFCIISNTISSLSLSTDTSFQHASVQSYAEQMVTMNQIVSGYTRQKLQTLSTNPN